MLKKNEVLELLQQGHHLVKYRHIGYSSILINNQYVHKGSFNALAKQGSIKFSHKDGHSTSVYVATERKNNGF